MDLPPYNNDEQQYHDNEQQQSDGSSVSFSERFSQGVTDLFVSIEELKSFLYVIIIIS